MYLARFVEVLRHFYVAGSCRYSWGSSRPKDGCYLFVSTRLNQVRINAYLIHVCNWCGVFRLLCPWWCCIWSVTGGTCCTSRLLSPCRARNARVTFFLVALIRFWRFRTKRTPWRREFGDNRSFNTMNSRFYFARSSGGRPQVGFDDKIGRFPISLRCLVYDAHNAELKSIRNWWMLRHTEHRIALEHRLCRRCRPSCRWRETVGRDVSKKLGCISKFPRWLPYHRNVLRVVTRSLIAVEMNISL